MPPFARQFETDCLIPPPRFFASLYYYVQQHRGRSGCASLDVEGEVNKECGGTLVAMMKGQRLLTAVAAANNCLIPLET